MVIEIKSDDLLSKEQLRHHIKIFAGPGAGKTHFLVENVKNIIKIDPKIKSSNNKKVLCITYTNAAVDEIKRRLVGYEYDVEVYTIHGFIIEYIIKPYQTELTKHMLNDFGIEIKTKGKILSQIEGLGILHGHDKDEIFEYIKKESKSTEELTYSKKIMGEVEININEFCYTGNSEIKKSTKITDSHTIPIKKYIWSTPLLK